MTDQSREFAKKQITRLAMLVNFPQKFPPAIEDLIDALMVAPTEDMAKAVVDHFLGSATSDTRCPMASEVRSEINSRQEEFRPDTACQACGGDGHIYGRRGEHTYAERCNCWARRPAPVYKRLVPSSEFAGELAAAARKLRAK